MEDYTDDAGNFGGVTNNPMLGGGFILNYNTEGNLVCSK